MRDEVQRKLKEIFQAVLELPPGTDVATVEQQHTAAWDSLAHTLLVSAMESEFGLQIEATESLELVSYQAAARFLEEQGL